MRTMCLSVAMIAALATTTATAAPALEGRSVVVLCWEQVDGTDSGGCAYEGAARGLVGAEGGVLVDSAQAARTRAALSPERFAKDAALPGIDVLDAEVAVVVRARATKLLQRGAVASHQIDVAVDVVDVARGRFLATKNETLTLMALSPAQAHALAAKELAKQALPALQKELVAALSAPPSIELWVYDLPPGFDTVAAVESALSSSRLTTSQRRLAFHNGVAHWRVALAKDASADAVGAHLERAGLLLAVQGASGDNLQLAFRPQQFARLPVRVETTTKKGTASWVPPLLPGLVKGALLGEGFIDVVDDAAMVTVKVEAAPQGKKTALSFSLVDDGKKVVGAARVVDADVAGAAARGARDVVKDLKKHIEQNPARFAALKRAFDAPRTLQATVVVAGDDGVLDGGAVARGGVVGRVDVTPALADARVRLRVLADGSDAPFGPWRALDDGAVAGRDLAFASTTATTVRVEAEVEGRIGERLFRTRAAQAALWLPPGTVQWSNLASFADAVDPAAPWTTALFAAAPPAAVGLPSESLARAARAWDAVAARRVAPNDAEHDVDAFAGPRFVVTRGADVVAAGHGDAVSIAAVLAAAFEHEGVETRVLRTPDRVLLAVDAGLPHAAWPAFASSASGVLDDGGRLFLVVDPVSPRSDLFRAVERGAEALARAPQREVVSLRAAWRERPPLRDTRATTTPATTPATTTSTTSTTSTASTATREPVKLVVLDLRAPAASPAERVAFDDALVQGFARVPALQVLSTEDVRRLLTLEAQKQVLGCDEGASCLAEIADAMGARLAAFASAAAVGKDTVVTLTLSDAQGARVLQRAELRGPSLDAVVARLGPAAGALAATALESSGVVSSGPWTLAALQDRLARRLPDDAFLRARFFALTGDVDAARAAAARVKDGKKKSTAEANVAAVVAAPAGRFQLSW